MSLIPDDARPGESDGNAPESGAGRKLTREELLDLVGAYATKGDQLTRAEREVYARQLAEIDHPDNPAARRFLIAMLIPTREERRASAEESARNRKPPRQPPPGKTWQDMVIGKWPGSETDEEINAWLEEIS